MASGTTRRSTGEYNKGRASEGANCLNGLANVADKVRDIMGIAPGIRDTRV